MTTFLPRQAIRRQLQTLLLSLALSHLAQAYAQHYIPFAASNMNPFSISHDALQAQSWHQADTDPYSLNLRIEMANFSIQSANSTEKIILDGETYKTTLSLQYAFSERITAQLSLPYIHYSSGLLDNTIEQWHDAFGLSNVRRSDFASNRLHLEYLENGVSVIKQLKASHGPGDIRLSLAYRLTESTPATPALSINLALKLPSGDPDRLTGNGATDWGISLHALQPNIGQHASLALVGGLGFNLLGQGEILAARQRNHSSAAYAGLHWTPLPRWQFTTQLQLQSASYDSELDELGKTSSQLLIGGLYRTAEDLYYQFAFGENLYTDATPDFSLYFSIHSR